MKVCTKCRKEKPLEEFNRAQKGTQGRTAHCKGCIKEYARQYHLRNRDRVRARNKAWGEANAERVREAGRRWYLENRERRKQTADAWRKRNAERVNEKVRAWQAQNRAKVREIQRNWAARHPDKLADKRARRQLALADADPVVVGHIAFLYTQPCGYCGATENITIDHVVPLVRGGTHTVENLVAACGWCNSSKGGKLLGEWDPATSPR